MSPRTQGCVVLQPRPQSQILSQWRMNEWHCIFSLVILRNRRRKCHVGRLLPISQEMCLVSCLPQCARCPVLPCGGCQAQAASEHAHLRAAGLQALPHTFSPPCCSQFLKRALSKLFLLFPGSSRISRPTRHQGNKGTLGKLGPAPGG